MNVIDQAESLLANDQWHEAEWSKCREILPDLVAECKAQQERAASYSTELAAAALGKPRAWLMTEEKVAALKAALSILESEIKELNGEDYMGAVHARQSLEGIAEEIRAMLAEAKQ